MKALWHIRVGMTALWLVGTNPVSASMPDTTLVRKGETLSARQETAQSLLMLNRFIDDASTRPLARADSLLLLRALSGNARNYQVLGNNHQALAYFQRAISLAKLLDEQRRLAQLYNNVFGIYYQQREYTQAEDLLLLSLDINKKNNDSTAIRNNYNNLGLLALGSKEYGKVLGYYNLAVDFTPQSDKVGRSLILTNRADLYDVMGQYAHAERELTEALRLQHGLPLTAQTIQTSLNMALLKARLGKRTEAKALQPAIYRALHTLPLAAQVNSLAQLADIHFALGDSLAGLRDILRFQRLDDSLRRATNTSQLQQLLVAYDTERLRQTNDTLKTAVSHRTMAFYGTAGFLVVLLALVGLLVRRMRIDKQKSRLISEQQERLLQYEQREHERRQKQLANELDHKNRQLTTYTLDLASINEFHQHIADDLTELRSTVKDPEASKSLHDIILRLGHFNDKPLGDDFRIYFDEVHPGFLQKLAESYPLSKTDLRLCAYLYLGMTTKEIAALTYKEVRSVESQRNRLRKKLGLAAGSDFAEFFALFAEKS